MNTLKVTKKVLLAVIPLLFSYSCQFEEAAQPTSDAIDEDMLAAKQLVDAYATANNARSEGELAITVLRYEDGVLWYDTNTDDYEGYQPVDEETVTATVKPGEFVFWYGGKGLSDLDGIEFDEESTNALKENPEEVELDLLWVSYVPVDIYMPILKYDILYKYEGFFGSSIRLDPKIKVDQ